MLDKDIFSSFKFFCRIDKEKEAIRIFKKRNDSALWPFSIETTRNIINSDGSVKTLRGVTLFGICFSNRFSKIQERLSQRGIAAFDDEFPVQRDSLLRLVITGLEDHGKEAEDLDLRLN